VALTIILMLASVTLLYELKLLYSSSQPGYEGSIMSRDLMELFDARLEAVDSCVARRIPDSKPDFFGERISVLLDSLKKADESPEIKREIDTVCWQYNAVDTIIRQRLASLRDNRDSGTASLMISATAAADSVRAHFWSLQLSYHSTLLRGLESREKEISTATSTAVIILLLTFVISMVITWFVARELTRPILALKAGTEKVGEGKYISVAVSSNDEIADLTRAFNLMSDKLKQLEEMRAQLMSEISHEMRTPLQVIKAGCYSVMHTKNGPELTQRQRDAVGMIHQATNRINQFVNSFLDIAKMEAGLMKFNFETMSLADLLGPLIQEAQLIAQTRQINLGMTSEEIPPIKVDRDRLSQVFSNLLSNALKYTPDNGTISVTLTSAPTTDERPGRFVRVDVTDTGVGIPEADLAKLFNKFYQAKNTPLVNEKGSGLGLALVKYVVEAHNGRVSVASTVGKGSTFTVFLPV
jgi:signal transduction histidine kinase